MAKRLELSEGLRFTCTQCGDCCRSGTILLGPGERDRLESLDWTGIRDELSGVDPSVPLARPGMRGRRLARRSDGACVFLGEKNDCLIHRHFGGEAKPLVCQLFPFSFYPMGDRAGVDCSFACRSISEGTGAPAEDGLPGWAGLVERIGEGDAAVLSTNAGKRVPSEVLWEIEHTLVGFIRNRELDFVDRVRCCLAYVDFAVSGNIDSPTAPDFRAAMAVGIPHQIRKTPRVGTMNASQRALLRQWLVAALNPPDAAFEELPPSEQRQNREALFAGAEKFRDQNGPLWIAGVPVDATHDRVSAVGAEFFSRSEQSFLEAFFSNKILGQKFIMATDRTPPLDVAVRRLLLLYPMIVWTSRVLAACDRRSEVEECDVRHSVRRLDASFGPVMDPKSLGRELNEAVQVILRESPLVLEASLDAFQSL